MAYREEAVNVSSNELLPPNHQYAMEVPRGGSNCAKCRYLVISKGEPPKCGNEYYSKWNHGDPYLLKAPDIFCSDWFEAR